MIIRPDLQMYAKTAKKGLGYVAGQIEVTSACFQKCRMCDSWREDANGTTTGSMGWADFLKLWTELKSMPTFEHLSITGGDPQKWHYFDDLLEEACRHRNFERFALQLNTALTQRVDPSDVSAWLYAFQDLAVSLDGVSVGVYARVRGEKPESCSLETFKRNLERLQHPRLQLRCCVSDMNLDHMPEYLASLRSSQFPIRKVVLLPVIGDRLERKPDFWERWGDFVESITDADGYIVPGSFPFDVSLGSENAAGVRDWVLTQEAKETPCYAGSASFHVKPDGSVYPCCLAGGEALATLHEYRIGNAFLTTLEAVRQMYKPKCHYVDGSPCVQICQYKQAALNLAAHRSEGTVLSMP